MRRLKGAYLYTTKMKILLFGGSGTLGAELRKLNADIFCPTHSECDIYQYTEICRVVDEVKPDIIINAAAVIDNRQIDKNPCPAIADNIIGAANLAIVSYSKNIRLVYLSTDYIYEGTRGNYREDDPIKPFNLYSWTKLGGECSAVAVKNHLIIRTSFGKNSFDYDQAFTDKWVSKDYVDVIAPLILEAALSPLTGVLNLGTERKTLFDHAKERNPDVKPIRLSDTNFFTPYDTSLNLQKWIDYKSSKAIAKPHTKCRCCGSDKLTKYLDLGLMPLANNLEFTAQAAKAKERYPLQVMFCNQCALSQLSVVVDPEEMFSHYVYRSSVNAPYVKHCRQMAVDLHKDYGIGQGCFMIDIAGNDGTLLKEFREEIGLNVLNVDPATNLVPIAEAAGIESIVDFWSEDLARKIVATHGKADLITATNVFAHLDDIHDFMKGCRAALSSDGILIIENPYIVDFVRHMEYDTLYHEHVTVWGLKPMMELCVRNGMQVVGVEKKDIHGGTMRYHISRIDSSHIPGMSVQIQLAMEFSYNSIDMYQNFSSRVTDNIRNLQSKLVALKKSGAKIVAFGASAKGSTLLNYGGFNTDIIDYIADETPEKIGKYTPGTGIQVLHPQMIMKTNPDYILILAWNFTDAIVDKVRALGFKGKFIVPIPEYKIIE